MKSLKTRRSLRIAACALSAVVAAGSFGGYYVYAQKISDEPDALEETSGDVQEQKEEEASVLSRLLTGQTGRDDSSSEKEETVYVVTDAAGTPDDVIVSDWLKNSTGSDVIEDVTDLEEIENVKGEETFSREKDGRISWQANGKDIYYQGKTKRALPVDMKISYFLDGKEMTPEELKGKSGHVKIRLDYTNREKEGDVYVPFTAVTGMLLNDRFTNIEVENGKAISDGSRNMIVGYAFPGLADSLQLDSHDLEGIKVPDYVEISADVTDFSVDMIMTVLMSDILQDLNYDKNVDLSSVENALNELDDASDQLTNGGRTLAEGMQTLQNGINDYTDGAAVLKDGIQNYTGGVSELTDGLKKYAVGFAAFKDGLQSYTAGASKLQGGIQSYTDGVSKVKNGVDAYTNGVAQVAAGTQQLAEKSGALSEGVDQLAKGAAQAQGYFEGENGLLEGAGRLSEGIRQLDTALNAGLTEEEKQQAASQVEAMFAEDQETYQGIAGQAAGQYESALTQSSDLQAQVEGGMTQAVSAAYAAAFVQINQEAYAQQGIEGQLEADAQNFAAQMTQASAGQISDTSAQLITGIAQGTSSQVGSMAAEAAKQGAAAGAQNSIASTKSAIAAQIEQGGLPEGADALKNGIDQIYQSGIVSLTDGMSTLNDSVPDLMNGVESLNEGASALNQKGETLKKGVDTLNQNSSELNSGADALKAAGSRIENGADTLHAGTDTLHAGADTLQAASGRLNAGADALNSSGSALKNGAGELKNGADQLSDGLIRFDEDGIKKLTDTYDGDVRTLLDRVDLVLETGRNYQTFSGLKDGMTGSVKFIIRTEGIGE